MDIILERFYFLFGLTQLVGFLCVALVLFWVVDYCGGFAWSNEPKLQFNWHTFLMTLGFVYLFANSILVFRGIRTLSMQKVLWIHIALQTAAIPCVVLALIPVFNYHSVHGIPDLYSLHAWPGLAAIIVYIIQWSVSLLLLLNPKTPPKIKTPVLQWHAFFGIISFVLSIGTSVTGFLEMAMFRLKNDYGKLGSEAVLINVLGMMFILFGILVVHLLTTRQYRRPGRPDAKDSIQGIAE